VTLVLCHRIKVGKTNVTLTDVPKNCLRNESMTEEEVLTALRVMLLNDFKAEGNHSGSLSKNEYVCSMRVVDDDGYVDFKIRRFIFSY
jgi:hypothetical protein